MLLCNKNTNEKQFINLIISQNKKEKPKKKKA